MKLNMKQSVFCFAQLLSRIALAAFCLVSWRVTAQSTPPLRSYAIAGTENSRSYDPASGWTQSTQAFSGTLDLVTATEARLTKVYATGDSVTRDLILQWAVDLSAPSQGGAAVEAPDPNDPVIKRTTYNLALKFDGLRYTAAGNFLTRAWMSVIPGIYDWFNVAYGDFAGSVVSPIGIYNITGWEQAGKNTASYAGTFTLLTPSTAQLAWTSSNGASTVNLLLDSAVDPLAESQTVTATQIENQPGQTTTYILTFNLAGVRYSIDSVYARTEIKGKKTRVLATGAFSGSQP